MMSRWKVVAGALALSGCLLAGTARAENWPRFRGPDGQGDSSEKNLPIKWTETENVAWKAEVPGVGWSSPIVWGDKVFVTATSDDGVACRVVCFDAKSGKLAWDKEVFKQKPTRKEGKNSYATPTPVTDGKRVYAFFSGGGAAALDFDGAVAWTDTSHPYYSQHGLGASPILYDELLIIPFDWSSPTGELRVGWQIPWEKSYVLALDKNTGKEAWRGARGPSRISHMTPRVVDVEGKPQLVSTAGDVVEGFDPQTGKRLWWAFNGGEGVVPSPVFGDGLVFTSSGFPTQAGDKPIYAAVRAFRLGGQGDVTQSNLVWEEKKAVPMVPSYAFHDHLLYTLKEDGIAQCLEAQTGKLVWKHRVQGGSFAASPVVADGKLYFTSEDGLTTVIEAGRDYKELAQNPVTQDAVQASIAVSNGHLFLRTRQHLYCIGSKP